MLYGYKFEGKFSPEEGHYFDSSRILLDPYAKELGVNCIELMPCHEFNGLEYYRYNSVSGDYKVNFWGYSTVNYFSPMTRYSSDGMRNCGREAINEFKLLVREAHKRGIEVFMDVVFNHTAEGNEKGLILSFKVIDNNVYCMLAPKGEFYNYSVCGNTFNCNHPKVRQFILDCLRYWVAEMHVDGFRFDLASIMTRSSSLWDAVNVFGNPIDGDLLTTATPLDRPPLIHMMSNDPILQEVKVDSVKGEICIAFNAHHLPVTVALPERPGYKWEPMVDTGKAAPFDFLTSDLPERDIVISQYAHFLDANLYPMLCYSSIILLLSPDNNVA